jgi:hypothetical protein
MHVLGLENILWIFGVAGNMLLLVILFSQRLFRNFPIFSLFVLWDAISDPLLLLVATVHHGAFSNHYLQAYYSFSIVEYLLGFGVLLEIAANVLRPAKQSFSKGILSFFLGAMLVTGLVSFFFAAHVNAASLANPRTFQVLDTTIAVLRLIIFFLLAGFAQVLGLSWRNYVLQLTTGLAFYSIVMLAIKLAQSQLRAGPLYYSRYKHWGEFGVIGYLCTLYFWCYAFAKKEAPRKEFSPQMTRILVSLSGSTERQRTVLARSRDH